MPRYPTARRAPTMRTLATVAVAGIALVAVPVAAALLRTATMLESATASIVQNAQSWALASEAELALLMYQRISNLYVVTRDPELDATRREVVSQMRTLLASAEEHVSSEFEQALLDDVNVQLDRYLEERAAIEAAEFDIGDVLRLTGAMIEETAAKLGELHDLNEAEVRAAQAEAMRWNRLAVIVAASSGLVLIGGLFALALGLHRYVVRPILELHDTIERFRHGADDARMTARGLREVSDLGQRFNEMADALAKQRQLQLAFLAGVAHDLRNPLNALKIGMQAIAREQSETRRDRAHQMLDRQVDRLARMIEDLLDATRIEAGRLELRRERFDLRDAVEDMIRLYAPTSPDHYIQAEMPSEPVVIDGDSLRIEQVVSNLLSNAIKFSPHGGEIQVRVTRAADAVALEVQDHGIGIRREDREEIFLPFRRTSVDVAPGAGLGLSVVRRIVEAHDGRIEVESEPEQGSTFRVILPARKSLETPTTERAGPAAR